MNIEDRRHAVKEANKIGRSNDRVVFPLQFHEEGKTPPELGEVLYIILSAQQAIMVQFGLKSERLADVLRRMKCE